MKEATSKQLGLNESAWTYGFVCDGRRYSLFKRERTRSGAWHLDVWIKGARIQRSLDTNVAAAAVDLACNNFIRPARSGRTAQALADHRLRRAPVSFASLGALEDTYVKMSVGKVKAPTVRNNLSSFRLVVRRGLDNEKLTIAEHRVLCASVLSGKLVSDFEDWMARDAVADGRNLESNKRSVGSYLRQARSLFKDLALPRYAEMGVLLPDLTPFMKRKTEKPAKLKKPKPDDALVQRTMADSMHIRESDPPVYLIWLLGLCSLRRGEIAIMRWSWMQEHNGRTVIVVPDSSKSGSSRTIPVAQAAAVILKSLRPESAGDGFVLSASNAKGLRGEAHFKRLDLWMRFLGWQTNHTLHEMRRLCLWLVRNQFSLDVAQAFAGHADQRTTQDSYVGDASTDVEFVLPFTL